MLRILLGLLLVVGGAAMTIKGDALYRIFGPVAWAEAKLGMEGGSRLFYKLVGIGIIFLGFIVMTGIWYDILNAFAGLIGLGAK